MAIVCLNSCTSSQQKNNVIGQLPEESYIIPDTLYSFFSEHLNNKSKPITYVTNAGDTDLPYFAEEFAVTFIVKVYMCRNTSCFASIKRDFTDNKTHEFKSEEGGYFVIGSERDILNGYDTLSLKEQYMNHQNIPLVLNFHEIFKEKQDFYDKTTVCGLPKDYEILVIKSGNEYVLPEKYKYNWSVLPDKLKHGYSSGVAFNKTEPYIIYWVVAW